MSTAAATKSHRANTYAGQCSKCGERVAAGAGYLGPKVNGKWTVEHTGCFAIVGTPALTAAASGASVAPRRQVHRSYSTGGYSARTGGHVCHLGRVCDECS